MVTILNDGCGYAVVSLRVMPMSAVGGRLVGSVTLRAVGFCENFRVSLWPSIVTLITLAGFCGLVVPRAGRTAFAVGQPCTKA